MHCKLSSVRKTTARFVLIQVITSEEHLPTSYKILNLISVGDVKPSIMFQLHRMVRINPVLAWLLSTRRVVKSVPIRGQGN